MRQAVEQDIAQMHLGEPMGLAQMHAEILEQLRGLRKQHPGTPPIAVASELFHLEKQLEYLRAAMTGLGDPVTGTLVGESSRRAARPRR